METLVEQVKQLTSKPEKEESVGTVGATKGDKEVAHRKKLPYAPFDKTNPYPPRPQTLENRMPQMYDLYGDKTFDSLAKKASSTLKYEHLVLAPVLTFLYNAVQFSERTLDPLDNQDKNPASAQEIEQRVYATHNTVEGAFTLLANRYSIIQLRASLDGDASAHGGTEALRARLAFLEEKIGNENPTLVELADLAHKTPPRASPAAEKARAVRLAEGPAPMLDVLSTSLPGTTPFPARAEAADSPGESATEEGSLARGGANAEVQYWVPRGARINWLQGPPQPFDHGVSLRDLTETQQTWLKRETQRHLDNGAWVRARKREHVSRIFLVPKTGSNHGGSCTTSVG
ncbi:hypothetical protein CYMTET_42785 [Cymbomonas tetramitiformis]|uniref:Uncharacterized protein n=1 Tax=Cymbomonas tetramitiformis TaxID=36881 RepID=A0AAE0C5F4_9CHLO|nr:hypothetical protein CYMTET_42785 [Cymbomonas tetramitiformis]